MPYYLLLFTVRTSVVNYVGVRSYPTTPWLLARSESLARTMAAVKLCWI